tara:strand:+ start:636 stop:1181 length:546 start_codon:yes stop_codon:yes gene_type:complete
MGLFNSKEQLFNDLEVYDVDRIFLNLHNYIKKFKFDHRGRTKMHGPGNTGEHLTYDLFINNRRVRFGCTKILIRNLNLYEEYYESDKGAKSDKGYIGLPSVKDMREAKVLFPFKVLEMDSIAYIKHNRYGSKAVKTSKTHYLWILYQDKVMRWDEELIKDFNKTATNLIKETIKNLSKLKK